MSTQVELPITGMTCASCANRIERKLNKLDGVTASVNYATEKAAVTFDDGAVSTDDLIGAVRAAGYDAVLPAPAGEAERGPAAPDPTVALRNRLILAAVLSLPVPAAVDDPALQFDNWQWLAWNLATPVVLYAGWPFHKAAWANLRTRPRRWTRSSASARSPRGRGRSSRSSSATPA
jgi:Cu+-exporting ATPase